MSTSQQLRFWGGKGETDSQATMLEAASEIDRLCSDNALLRVALKRVLADIADYEKVNNLAPNPGRDYCWDSVADAHAALNIHECGGKQ